MVATFSCILYIVQTYEQEPPPPPDVQESWEEWEASDEAQDWEKIAARFSLAESIACGLFMLNFVLHFYVSDQVCQQAKA